MLLIKIDILLFLLICRVSHCQRRIKDGYELKHDRRYVVYLVKAQKPEIGYDTWLCGGAIVSSEFVVTSAACVNDVEFLYVIAGYKKYVPDNEIETDQCTSQMKKKVVYTCSPAGYILKYGELDYWSDIDIALVKVESPFDFNDTTYETLCSYKPSTIPINYDEQYQEAGNDALVMGWGHSDFWRRPGDTYNYNQPSLRYAPTLLMNKTACIMQYKDYANMSRTIQRYMICSLGKGNIDDEGKTIQQTLPLQTECTTRQQKLLGFEGVSCENGEESSDYDDTRRVDKGFNHTNNVTLNDFNDTHVRRSGICQNDHGGPLITWVGASEVLIGIASVFKVSKEYECMGPYLYTSTVCTGLFLNCLLNSEFPERNSRRYLCDRPATERGYKTIERTISWKDHPAGTAENENIQRAGPEPKLSQGLKYLTNYNQPSNAGNVNHDTNNKFQAYKVPPIVSDGSKKRFVVQERDPKSILGKNNPVNDSHQEELESNKMHVNNNSSIPVRNEPLKNISDKQSLPVKNRPAEKITFQVVGRSSEKQSFSANERYPFNKRQQGNKTNPSSIRNSGNQTYLSNQRHPANQRLPVTGRYPVSKRHPKYLRKIPANLALRSVRPIRN